MAATSMSANNFIGTNWYSTMTLYHGCICRLFLLIFVSMLWQHIRLVLSSHSTRTPTKRFLCPSPPPPLPALALEMRLQVVDWEELSFHTWFHKPVWTSSWVDPGFFKRGGWHLGVPKSKEHAQKMWQFNNWNLPLIENYDKRNTSNVKVEIYQVTCLGCFPIFSTIFTFCFIYIVLLKRGWLATQTTPPYPTPRSTTGLTLNNILLPNVTNQGFFIGTMWPQRGYHR